MERCFSLWIPVFLPGNSVIRRRIYQFLHFRLLSLNLENSWFWRICDSISCFFSSDLKTVNIFQIEGNQNVEMERNTSRLRFREWNVKIPLILPATLEKTTAELDLAPLMCTCSEKKSGDAFITFSRIIHYQSNEYLQK